MPSVPLLHESMLSQLAEMHDEPQLDILSQKSPNFMQMEVQLSGQVPALVSLQPPLAPQPVQLVSGSHL
jgi:hypothetical protein